MPHLLTVVCEGGFLINKSQRMIIDCWGNGTKQKDGDIKRKGITTKKGKTVKGKWHSN